MNEIVFERALPMFAVMCLAGMALWKIRPSSSPLWAPVVMGLAIAFAANANRSHLSDRDVAGIVLAAVAAFIYMEWRSIHRPKPVPWSRRSILIAVGASVGCAAVIIALIAVRDHHRHAWENAPVVENKPWEKDPEVKTNQFGDTFDTPPTKEEIQRAAKKPFDPEAYLAEKDASVPTGTDDLGFVPDKPEAADAGPPIRRQNLNKLQP